jgi:hypothetical protein
MINGKDHHDSQISTLGFPFAETVPLPLHAVAFFPSLV